MSGLALRPYQQEAIAAIERAADRGVRRPLLVLATGLGKTVCFASLIAKRGGSALVLAHRDELLRQAAEKIRLAHPDLGMAVGFVAAARNDVRAPVVIGSVQTLARESRLAQLPREFTTVVVDEGHHAVSRSYRRILEHLSPAALVLGVTATPSRSDGGLGEVWEEIVYQYGVLDGIRNGYLADVRGIRVGLETRLEDVSQSGGDFDQEQLGEALEAASAPEHAVRVYQRHADGRKALLFAPTVKLARTFAAVFREAGIPAEAVDGTTPPDERAAMFERIQTGETRVLGERGGGERGHGPAGGGRDHHGDADALADQIRPGDRARTTDPSGQGGLPGDRSGRGQRPAGAANAPAPVRAARAAERRGERGRRA